MPVLLKYWKPGALVAGLVLAFALGWCGHTSKAPAIPAAEAHTLDSLGFTAPIFVHQETALAQRETVYVRQAAQSVRHATSAYDSSTFYKHLADSLTTQAGNQLDTAAVTWEGIAVERSAEAKAARDAADSMRVALVSDSIALAVSDARADSALARLAVSTDLNARLAADLKAADPPCRVLAFVHCPSREKVLVLGAAGGAAAVKWGPALVKAIVKALKP